MPVWIIVGDMVVSLWLHTPPALFISVTHFVSFCSKCSPNVVFATKHCVCGLLVRLRGTPSPITFAHPSSFGCAFSAQVLGFWSSNPPPLSSQMTGLPQGNNPCLYVPGICMLHSFFNHLLAHVFLCVEVLVRFLKVALLFNCLFCTAPNFAAA